MIEKIKHFVREYKIYIKISLQIVLLYLFFSNFKFLWLSLVSLFIPLMKLLKTSQEVNIGFSYFLLVVAFLSLIMASFAPYKAGDWSILKKKAQDLLKKPKK